MFAIGAAVVLKVVSRRMHEAGAPHERVYFLCNGSVIVLPRERTALELGLRITAVAQTVCE